MFLKRPRLYILIATLTTFVVVTFMGLYSFFHYNEQKKVLLDGLHEDTHITLSSLQKNLAHFIEAYAVHDYELLIKNDMQHKHFNAIIVEDLNMAQILGQASYHTGSLRLKNNALVAFDPSSDNFNEVFEECFYKQSADIFSSADKQIGSVSICSSNVFIEERLRSILLDHFFVAFAIASALTMILFFIIKRYTIAPITQISETLLLRDEDNLPSEKIAEINIFEFLELSKTINMMIDAVHDYKEQEKRNLLALQHERDRFNLAIEGTDDGIWDWDLETDKVFFSRRWKEMLGYRDHEIKNELQEWEKRVHPDDIEKVFEDVQKHLSQETQVYSNRHRVQCKDGSYKWILDRGKALFGEDGKAKRFVGFHTDITREMQHQQELEESAKHDALTHLPNRFLLNELLQKLLYRAERNKDQVAVIYVDLDEFKDVNDTYGHDAGDLILIELSNRMLDLVRQEDIVARLGGDEFVIAIGNIASHNELIPLLHRLLKALNNPVYYQGDVNKRLKVSASLGVSIYPQAREISPEVLLRQADQAMYDAKNTGKNQFRFFDIEKNQSAYDQQQYIQVISDAIQNNEFVLHYQPKVDMRKGTIIGFEALLRWEKPGKGLLFPDEFLPRINDSEEIMIKLGTWVFENAFKELSRLISLSHNLSMSINISAHEFNYETTLSLLKSLLEKYENIHPSQIELEILETHALKNVNTAHSMIKNCQLLGVSIALDDFGTGYSTMSYLKNLPVNTIKIDKSFVMDMLDDAGDYSIVQAAIGLANAFDCNTIAEGVESEEHGLRLIELGCKVGQGYAIAKPMPADAIEEWIQNFRAFESWTEARTPSKTLS